MRTKKISMFLLLSLFLFGVLTPQALSAEIGNEALISGLGATQSVAKVGISDVTGGQMIYTSNLLSRVIPEDSLVPFEFVYAVDIASADPEHPISAIVSSLFAAKSTTVLQNESNTSTSLVEIEDRAKVAGQINRIMKEFSYTFPLIDHKIPFIDI
jgi:hypothetical protein